MQAQIIELKGLTIPENSGLKRKHVRKPARRTKLYIEKYDRQTLIYDCFYDEEHRQYIITAPRFFNFWFLIKQHLYINGQKYTGRIKRETRQVYEQLYIKGEPGWQFAINSPEFSAPLDVRESASDLFIGQNCMFAMNKNNKLEWIRQWVQFHRNAHSLEGVVIIDNDSTDYTPQDIVETLKEVEGLKTALVVSAKYPYGPTDPNGKALLSPRFLQTAVMNLVKKDILKKARAVLNVDIDELVVPNSEATVFDAAIKSRLGAVSFREWKVYPAESEEKAYPQNAHTRIRKDQAFGNTKWCVNNQGFINNFRWAVHRFGGAFFPLTETKEFTYLHCWGASTSWKKDRYKQPDDLVEDSNVAAALQKYLS